MSDKRMFEFVEGSSSKFWEVWRDGSEVRTRYGRIGSDGQTTVKDEGTDEKAEKLYNKLVAEKTKKGYTEKTGNAAPAAAATTPKPATPKPAPKPAAVKPAPKASADGDDDGDGDGDGAAGSGGAGGGWKRYEVDEKFWAIKLDGSSHTVKFGKIGTNGAEKTKDFDDAAAARKDHDKLVAEKTKKGYALVEGDGGGDDGDDEAPAEEAKPAPKPTPTPAPKAAPAVAAKAAPAEAADEDEDEDEDGVDTDSGDEDDGDAGWRRFEVEEKFWAIKLDGAAHTVKYGKIGTPGQEKTKTFPDEGAALRDHDKLVEEKSGKGYEEVG